ncbi:hypothetical protein Goshw_025750 [Gossypium schwendimanii]|uniref:Uncharacterized protein n=1 Tax=Gossypium schwendimanii TaxID=34291 RepID=A0A7J9KNW8_GOSSC|nr:hypothetical protein [Gossypium schwendimanii]
MSEHKQWPLESPATKQLSGVVVSTELKTPSTMTVAAITSRIAIYKVQSTSFSETESPFTRWHRDRNP